jgi:hypothetical protein
LSAIKKAADLIVGALPLLGKAHWVALAAAPHAERVAADFTLAPFPRREGETPVMPSPAVTAPRPKLSRRRAA